MAGIKANSSSFYTISLLGSGKIEENKENDLQPPLPPSYAATVARQSTMPSSSTMPGEHRAGLAPGAGMVIRWKPLVAKSEFFTEQRFLWQLRFHLAAH